MTGHIPFDIANQLRIYRDESVPLIAQRTAGIHADSDGGDAALESLVSSLIKYLGPESAWVLGNELRQNIRIPNRATVQTPR